MHWLTVSAVFMLAAGVQGLTGAGYALVAAPVLLLIAPELVPVPLLWVELVLIGVMIARESFAVDLRALRGLLLASFPGALIGAAVLLVVPARSLSIVLGALVTAAAALALAGAHIPMTRWTMGGAGLVGGAMNSIAGMPGPPVALVYRPADSASLRTNLSVTFLVMSVFSLAVLHATGVGTWESVTTSVRYLPAVLVGFGVSRLLVHRVSHTAVSRAVLLLALASGLFLLLRALL